MQNVDFLPVKKLVLIVTVLLLTTVITKGQSTYLPESYQLEQKFDASLYSVNTSLHTSLRPYLMDTSLTRRYNALMSLGTDNGYKTWVFRKIFNEHLFDVKKDDFTFYGDFLPDLQLGRDLTGKTTTSLNTRGYQFGGTIGSKFSFYTSGYEDQGKFPSYYANYINKIGFVPGQGYDRSFGKPGKDWDYATAIISYTPNKYVNFTLGQDKTFIGDGYRSLLLSDNAAPYPLFRFTLNLGPVQYMMQWAYLEELSKVSPTFDNFGSNRRAYAAFHYVDWNATNRLSLGFFNAVIAQEADNNGTRHGFDVNLIDPVVFASSLGPSSQPDNVLAGFTGKYKILDKTALYAQLLLDRFKGSSSPVTTNGVQAGIRGADLFNVTNFNYLFEFNTVKPYTYTSGQTITNYIEYGQPLGDPLGANFREFIGILNYSIGRFDFTGQANYAKYGLDPTKMDYGKDVTKVLPTTVTSSTVGQGIATNLYYAEGTISFLVNPKYNLRFEVGGLFRDEKNSVADSKTTLITFGLRSSFRNLYHDF